MAATFIPVPAVKYFGSRESLLVVLLDHRFWRDGPPKTS